ncbi:hypothetical protein DFP73DRAFT_532764 [Morchella snyderi]|nr:hypothetical protein DFP73DRAFT_532764 [Morchella snyderi]
MSWFRRPTFSNARATPPPPPQPPVDPHKLDALNQSFASISAVTAPTLRIGRADKTLALATALLSDWALSTNQRLLVNITTSKVARFAITTIISDSGIFTQQWHLQQYLQRCMDADEAIYMPNGAPKSSLKTTQLRSAAAVQDIVDLLCTNWEKTRSMRWDTWLERATGRTPLRQFSVFRKPRHEVYCSLALRYHHDALRASESGDFKGALSILAEGEGACRMALELEEAMNADRQAHTEEKIFEEAADIAASFGILVSTCTASRALESGHRDFTAAVTDNAEKLMDYALLALDNYRHALSCATGKDIELEAESVYYVAKTYHILLKNETKAHDLYIRAISLVTTLSPKLPGGIWFTKAKMAVEARRAKLKAQEDSEWHTRRGPILEKVKDKVEEIHKKSSDDARQLVQWLMETYPPKSEGDTPDLTKSKTELSDKRAVLEAVRRYHPDKNIGFGDEWHVLSEEITKCLNNCFGRLKSLP